jgi:hypothetical protein
MGAGNPRLQITSSVRQLIASPDFAKLSPEAQAELQKAAASGSEIGTPAFTSAIQEMSTKNIDMPGFGADWRHVLMGLGVMGGLAALPFALGAGAAAAAPSASSGVGPLAGGYGAATTEATVPASLAANGGGAAGGILGVLGKYAPMVGDIGNIASQAAGGLASGRRDDAQVNARAIAENNAAKVAAANYNLNLPSVRTNQVARGEVLNTMKDAPMTGDPRIDKFAGGGLRPSAFGPNSRAAGAEMSRYALSNLMDPSKDRLTPQEIPETHASTPENIAAGIGLGGSILSLLQKYGGRA